MALTAQQQAYYQALINAWNGTGALPAGCTGNTFAGAGDTPANKLAAINSWVMAGQAVQQPVVVQTTKIYNCIDFTNDWPVLSAAQQASVNTILSMGIVDASPGTQVRAQLVAAFTGRTSTLNALTALANSFKPSPFWWQVAQANGGGGLLWAPRIHDAVAVGLVSNPTNWSYRVSNRRFDSGTKSAVVDIAYTQLGADGITPTGVVLNDLGFGDGIMTDASIAAQAIKRIANVFLPGDAALAALTAS